MNKLFACILLISIIACPAEEEGSQTEFITAPQQTDFNKRQEQKLLISKAHNHNLSIHYGFSDNRYCNGQFNHTQEQQIKDSISKSLGVWLLPLTVKYTSIVNKYEYHHRRTTPSDDDQFYNAGQLFKLILKEKAITDEEGRTRWSGRESTDLIIIFYCQQGRSFASWKSNYSVEIHMYQGNEIKAGVSNLNKYRLTTLHHEIGHAFGLGDTYIEPEKERFWRYNASTGGDTGTVGKHPLSVMNYHYLVALDSVRKLQLGADDIAGINWLYNYYFAKNIGISDCPEDYIYEGTTKGCAPRYPLIFATKHNDYTAVTRMLEKDSTTINEQDELGNSALHYAAYAHVFHDSYIYHYLVHMGANIKLKNNNGKTAGDLLSIKTR